MAEKMQPFWWFLPHGIMSIDIRVFNMREMNMAYIEGALVEIIQDSTVIKSGYTDSNGKYTTAIGAGTYKIRISKTGYKTIEKNETLTQATELMVNLPEMIPLISRSGIAQTFILGSAENPVITTILKEFVDSNLKTISISAIPQVVVI